MDEVERARVRAERKAARKKRLARAASRRYYAKYEEFFSFLAELWEHEGAQKP